MRGRPFVIGVFVSAPSVDDNIKRIAARGENVIRISYQGLEEAIASGRRMEEEGVEVIISRRGTASLLRENLHIPVLSFPESSLAVLISVREAAHKGRRVFLPSFRNQRKELQVVGELLGVEFVQGVYTDSASLRQLVYKAAQDGFDVVVGGLATMRYAAEFGILSCELISSEEEVAETIENAESVAQAQRDQKQAAQKYQTIVDAASDGIIAVDPGGNVTTINRTARQLLKIPEDVPATMPVSQLIPRSALSRIFQDKKPVRDKVVSIRDEMFVFHHIPVLLGEELIGVVSSFKEASHLIRSENTVRRTLAKGFVAKYVIDDLIHGHPAMVKVAEQCREFARTDSCILISGETGTGKEIIAQSIHNLSRRKAQPFVSVHCAALPEQLLESELFGHEEGAFTGSKKGGKPGLFELAHQGTIFLDEIDSTSLNVQLRLLRVLQENEVMRVGAEQKVPVDVRVIAAAGRDLWEAVQEGAFRKDLFFRLNVLPICVPPLWARKEDIPELLRHFLAHYASKYGVGAPVLPSGYVQKLMEYPWPGNVRQLRHFAEQLLLNCCFHSDEDTLGGLLENLNRIAEKKESPPRGASAIRPTDTSLQISRQSVDAEKIRAALERVRYNKSKAAEILGVGRTTLWRKMKELGLPQ